MDHVPAVGCLRGSRSVPCHMTVAQQAWGCLRPLSTHEFVPQGLCRLTLSKAQSFLRGPSAEAGRHLRVWKVLSDCGTALRLGSRQRIRDTPFLGGKTVTGRCLWTNQKCLSLERRRGDDIRGAGARTRPIGLPPAWASSRRVGLSSIPVGRPSVGSEGLRGFLSQSSAEVEEGQGITPWPSFLPTRN